MPTKAAMQAFYIQIGATDRADTLAAIHLRDRRLSTNVRRSCILSSYLIYNRELTMTAVWHHVTYHKRLQSILQSLGQSKGEPPPNRTRSFSIRQQIAAPNTWRHCVVNTRNNYSLHTQIHMQTRTHTRTHTAVLYS